MQEPASEPGEVTELLARATNGDADARDRLYRCVHAELRARADALHRQHAAGPMLQPTVLVNEAYWRLVHDAAIDWQQRSHFYRAAGRAMRQILVDQVRSESRLKRGGGAALPLDGSEAARVDPQRILEIDDALRELARANPRWAAVVELRFFAGLTIDTAAEALGVSPRTVQADWQFARTWLHERLAP